MREYITKAVVLDRADAGELDARITLFTQQFGKVIVRAKSIRKITSKLSSHLQPLNLISARIVFSKSVQIVDALKEKSFLAGITDPLIGADMLEAARLIAEATEREHQDAELWKLVSQGKLIGKDILRVLGFDPDHGKCEICGRANPERFVIRRASYACTRCLPMLMRQREYYALTPSIPRSEQ